MKIRGSLLVAMYALAVVACAQPDRDADSREAAAPAASASAASAPASEAVASTASTANVATTTLPRIVFLGDSLTAGLGLQPEQSIPSLIRVHLQHDGYKYQVVNAGVSGDTSAGGLRRLNWSLEGPVEILVIELGANDGLRGLPVAEMKRNLDEIITTAKQRRITVVLTGMEAPPNYGPAYTSEFRQVFSDLAKQHDVVFVPFFLDGVAGNPGLNQGDGIHPNPEGAQVVERTIWKALEPLLDKD
jgi:acyl-CoA thioesterase-1